jgi:tetratricopeptide (TPR) repeat protein
MLLGNAYLKMGDAASAERCYRNVLERDPRAMPARINLALALYRQGKREEATRHYRQFLEDHGNEYPQLAVRAQTAIELIEEASGRFAGGAAQDSR